MREDDPLFVISEAAALAGMHPQTLRQYDRLGLVSPRRAAGRGRRYSLRDIERLREVQRLSHDEGVNLAGIKKIIALEERVERLESLLEILALRAEPGRRVFTAATSGDVVIVPRGRRAERLSDERGALVRWTPTPPR